MNIRSIRAFVEVARQRSVSEAAASLGYSQSAVSKQIAEFERGVGSRVFHRDCAGLPLTACGERLLPLAVQVMALVDALGRGEPASRFSADAIGRQAGARGTHFVREGSTNVRVNLWLQTVVAQMNSSRSSPSMSRASVPRVLDPECRVDPAWLPSLFS